MIDISIEDQIRLISFWLSFVRWASILIHMPILDFEEVPNIIKVLFSLLVTYAFFPHTEAITTRDILFIGKENFWALTMYYSVIGFGIGYLVKSILNVFIGAGVLITQSIGLTAVRYFDPSFAQTVGPFERLIHFTILIMVVTSGALLPMFKGTMVTFHNLGLQQLSRFDFQPEFFVHFFKSVFLASLLLSAPLILTNFLLNVVLGILARMVPQLNVLMVSFVVNIGMGFMIFSTTCEEFFHVGFKLYTRFLGEWFQFIN